MAATTTNGQKIDVLNLNSGNGFVTIRDEQIEIISGYTKILHNVNLSSWIENVDILEHNINKLNHKNDYPTLTYNLIQLQREIEKLLDNHDRKRRGLVNVVGKGLKFLAGTMDYDDELEIKQTLETNEQNTKNLVEGLNDQIKINHDFNDAINNITRHINGQQLEIKYQLTNLGNTINKEFAEIANMQHAFQINYDIQLLKDQVKKVKENILMSQLGVLGHDILSMNEIDKFNITISKLANIKSTVIVHENQIVFVLLIPIYSYDKFYKILIEPIPNNNNLELATFYKEIITDGNINYENLNGTIKFKELKEIKDSCIQNIFKDKPECNFKENKNKEIKQITNNIIVTKNIPFTHVIHNCHNYSINIIGNNLIRFENCKIEINNVNYENFLYYDNFIIPNFKNITIKNIVSNYSAEAVHLKNIENRKLIEQIKLRTITHEHVYFGTAFITISILILLIFTIIQKNQNKKTKIKVDVKKIDSPEQNLKGGGVTSETPPKPTLTLFPILPFV